MNEAKSAPGIGSKDDVLSEIYDLARKMRSRADELDAIEFALLNGVIGPSAAAYMAAEIFERDGESASELDRKPSDDNGHQS